ncbi:DUF7282 domain-containing protein [Haloplanus natans]|uniref:DUF7282 domain-containing protein n=1 Tax=Haloplanus natans TaxID=376171 RepID=UPI000677EF44|nr:hypothetical protein [Haloplanus natans]
MHTHAYVLASALVLSTVAFAVVGSAGAVSPPCVGDAGAGIGADPPRSVAIVDVVSDDRSNRSGVHPVEAGSTLLVRGTTNRRPDDTAIDVSVTDGPDADRFGFAVVESWGYDGVWTARLAVPANATPGTYTLEVQLDGDSDVQRFEVVERRPAALGRASLSDAGRVAIENVTLPDGGYLEVRDGDALLGRSPYLGPGTSSVVTLAVEGVDAGSNLRAVAVRGTPDSVGDPYRRNGTPVAVSVSLPPAGLEPTASATATPTPSATATATPTSSPTSTAPPGTTPGSGPGFGVVATVVALLFGSRIVGRF